MNYLILITATLFIAFETVFEGLHLAGFNVASEITEITYRLVATIICLAFVSGRNLQIKTIWMPLWKIFVGYILLRYALFDPLFNVCAGLDINFIGDTKIYDKILSWIRDMWGMGTIWFTRAIALFWGVAWLLGWENGIKNKLNNLKQF
jgi:hypothetical protein